MSLAIASLAAAQTPGLVRQQSVALPGVKLWFTDTGGSGTPIILLHANTGTSASWQAQAEAFSKAGYRVIAFDRRGWGKSIADPATGAQPGTVAEDLQNLTAYLKLEKFHLVGVAGGGLVALDYAAWHPEKLLSLVFSASTGGIQDKEVQEFIARFTLPGFAGWPEDKKELSLSYRGSNPAGVRNWLDVEEHARQQDVPASPPLRTPNTFAKLAAINVRTLVMAGDTDFYAPPGLMKLVGHHIRSAEWALIPDSGHSVAWEQSAIFNRNVLGFLKGERFEKISAVK